MVDAGPEQDHAAALGVDRVLRPLPREPDDLGGGHPGVLLLPRGRRRHGRVVVAAGVGLAHARPGAGQAHALDAVLGEQQVQHGGHDAVPDARHRHAASLVDDLAVGGVEARQLDLDGLAGAALVVAVHAERGVDVTELEVPPALTLLAEAVADRAVRDADLAAGGVDDGRLPHGVLARPAEVALDEELAGAVGAVRRRLEADQVRQVGELLGVGLEERRAGVGEVLLEHDVAHGHRECPVGAGRGTHPLVGELHALGVVGRDGHDLLPAVARLGHPVGVRGARRRDVGAPHHQVAGVPPVARLRHVGLVAEHLRRRVGQVGVPVVERQHRRADELEEARTGGVRHRRHRRDRGEAGDPVRAPALDGVDVRGGDDLGHLVPRRAHETALAARLLVGAGLLLVLHDRAPCDHGVAVLLLGGAEHLEQHAPDVGVAHPRGAVGVPAEGRATRAAAGLVLRPVGPGARVVGLLRLPRDDAVLDVDLPRARPGAVDAVRRAHHLVVAPAVAVEHVALASPALVQRAVVVADLRLGEEASPADQGLLQRVLEVGHDVAPFRWGDRGREVGRVRRRPWRPRRRRCVVRRPGSARA